MNDLNFYRAFEDQHRGSRSLIKERLSIYLPFAKILQETYPNECYCIDLGCGRGEWLELMTEHNFNAFGVDTDEGMLAASIAQQLIVKNQDALEALRALADNSQCIISGFHIAEHLPFEILLEIIKESLRALKPAGLLILETPNPENLLVGAANFYIDPTHQRPLPPLLLDFLPQYTGFIRTKQIYLQESKDLHITNTINLVDVLAGVSPDYAIIAQKKADRGLLSKFDYLFENNYGLTLPMLANRYDQLTRQTFEEHLSNQQLKIDALVTKLENLESSIETQLTEIKNSRSWRVTAPLRWFAHQVRILKERGIKSRAKAVIKKLGVPFAKKCITLANNHPKQRHQLIVLSKKLGIHSKLKIAYHKMVHKQPISAEVNSTYCPYEKEEYLSESAREIHKKLIAAIEANRRL